MTSQGFLNLPQNNPAMSGMGKNDKAQFYYRSQFVGFGEPFMNFGLHFDYAIKKKDPEQINNIGIGGFIESENMLNGALQKNAINLTIADRVFLDPSNESYIALGIGTSFATRYLDVSKLTFGDQYNSGRLFINSTLETFQKYPSFFSSNAGLSYVNNDENSFFQMGYGIFYINRLPSETMAYTEFTNAFLFNAMLNYEYQFPSMSSLLINLGYDKRLEKTYAYAGMAIGLPLFYSYNSPDNRLYFGLNYRVKDATVPYIQLLYNQYKFGISYDFYQNDLTMANISSKTFEISIAKSLRRRNNRNYQSLFNY